MPTHPRTAAFRVALRWLSAKGPSYQEYVDRKKQEGKKPLDKDDWEVMVGAVSEAKKDPTKKSPGKGTSSGTSSQPVSSASQALSYLSEFLRDEDKTKVDSVINAFKTKHEKSAEQAKKADAVIKKFRGDYEGVEKVHEETLAEIDAEYKKEVSKAETEHQSFVDDVVKDWSDGKMDDAEKDRLLEEARAETEAKYEAARKKSEADVDAASKSRDNAQQKLLDDVQKNVEDALDEPEEEKGDKTAALRVASRWLWRA